jgi:hypothetical protein
MADVFDPAGATKFFGDAVDKGSESNTLHHAKHDDVYRSGFFHRFEYKHPQ